MPDDDLQPLAPDEAVRMYLDHREPELSDKSLTNQKYRLQSFVTWCQTEGIDNLNDLTGRDLHRYRVWRSQDGGADYEPVNTVTLRGILTTLRKYLEFAASVDAVPDGMREQVLIPEVDPEDQARDEMLDADRAEAILQYIDRYQYASRDHVVLALLWHTGIRLGGLRALDVDDVDLEAPCLELRHRPDTETPLKNGTAAERAIAVGPHYAQLLDDYIHEHRHDVRDEYGRRPLVTSSQGRLTEVPIRRTVYRWTQPCETGSCPHDQDPDTCEWRDRDHLSECPSSRSPHGVRRGSITKHLLDGAPQEVVSDRMNVSDSVLDRHYDERSERERMEQRREFLRNT